MSAPHRRGGDTLGNALDSMQRAPPETISISVVFLLFLSESLATGPAPLPDVVKSGNSSVVAHESSPCKTAGNTVQAGAVARRSGTLCPTGSARNSGLTALIETANNAMSHRRPAA